VRFFQQFVNSFFNMKKRIEEKLQKNLNPKFLEVKNNSHLHAGHSGDNGSGETHFAIVIESDELSGMSRVGAHRRVNQILKEEFGVGLHALELVVR
jgi:BolA protein